MSSRPARSGVAYVRCARHAPTSIRRPSQPSSGSRRDASFVPHLRNVEIVREDGAERIVYEQIGVTLFADRDGVLRARRQSTGERRDRRPARRDRGTRGAGDVALCVSGREPDMASRAGPNVAPTQYTIRTDVGRQLPAWVVNGPTRTRSRSRPRHDRQSARNHERGALPRAKRVRFQRSSASPGGRGNRWGCRRFRSAVGGGVGRLGMREDHEPATQAVLPSRHEKRDGETPAKRRHRPLEQPEGRERAHRVHRAPRVSSRASAPRFPRQAAERQHAARRGPARRDAGVEPTAPRTSERVSPES